MKIPIVLPDGSFCNNCPFIDETEDKCGISAFCLLFKERMFLYSNKIHLWRKTDSCVKVTKCADERNMVDVD